MTIEYETWTRNEVALWSGASVTFGKRAKHREAVISYKGESRFVIFPDSPSDSARGVRNHIACVRRELLRLGAVRAVRRESAALKRPRRGGGYRREVRVGDPAPVIPDPWRALRPLQGGVQPRSSRALSGRTRGHLGALLGSTALVVFKWRSAA